MFMIEPVQPPHIEHRPDQTARIILRQPPAKYVGRRRKSRLRDWIAVWTKAAAR